MKLGEDFESTEGFRQTGRSHKSLTVHCVRQKINARILLRRADFRLLVDLHALACAEVLRIYLVDLHRGLLKKTDKYGPWRSLRP